MLAVDEQAAAAHGLPRIDATNAAQYRPPDLTEDPDDRTARLEPTSAARLWYWQMTGEPSVQSTSTARFERENRAPPFTHTHTPNFSFDRNRAFGTLRVRERGIERGRGARHTHFKTDKFGAGEREPQPYRQPLSPSQARSGTATREETHHGTAL